MASFDTSTLYYSLRNSLQRDQISLSPLTSLRPEQKSPQKMVIQLTQGHTWATYTSLTGDLLESENGDMTRTLGAPGKLVLL